MTQGNLSKLTAVKLTPQVKKEIDCLTYPQMRALWKLVPEGSMLFTGEVGEYFVKRLRQHQDVEQKEYENITGGKKQ